MPDIMTASGVLTTLSGWRLAKKSFYNNRWAYAIWLIAAVLLLTQPVVLLSEFRGWGPDALSLFKLYPHQLLIPPMCFVFALWFYITAVSLAWSVQESLRKKISQDLILAALATALFLYVELSRSPVMFLELSPNSIAQVAPNAQTPTKVAISTRSLTNDYLQFALISSDAGNKSQDITKQKLDIKTKLESALKYENWVGRGSWSVTRWFYAATFYIGMCGALSVLLSLSFVPVTNSRYTYIFTTKIVSAVGLYTLWVGARFYYSFQIKGPAFGPTSQLPPMDTLLWIAFAICITLMTLKWLPRNWNNTAPIVIGLGFPGVFGLLRPQLLDPIIGITSTPVYWLITFVALCIIIRSITGQIKQGRTS